MITDDLKKCLDELACGANYEAVFKWVSPLVSRHKIILFEINDRFGFYNLRTKQLICNRTFEMAKPFPLYDHKNYTIVKEDGKYNLLRYDGTIILPKWVDYIDTLTDNRFNIYGEGYNCVITLK